MTIGATMNTNDIRNHFLSHSPWVNPEETVDTVKAGDATKPVSSVAVGWVSSIGSLRAAAELGCDLFITHEPTFWDHYDRVDDPLRKIEPCLAKQRLLDESGMVVLRCHDAWDRWPGLGIRDSWAKWLGLDQLIGEDKDRWMGLYRIDPQPLGQFALHMAQRVALLGEDSVRVTGDADKAISHVALGVGCAVPDQPMIDMGADAMVVCYDGASYWQTRQRFDELGLGVIAVEHGTSELPGLMSLARYVQQTFSLKVHYLDKHVRPWTVSA